MRQVSNIVSIPAPIQGWNVRDPLPSMQPTYAPILDNVFCLPSELMVRKGYTKWATFTGNCDTILDYSTSSGTKRFFAAVNNSGACSIYDITSGGAVGAAVVSGLTSAKFKHAYVANSGGNFAYYVNGIDSAQLYDGTTWHTVTGLSAPYAITGPANTYFKDVITHKRRLWFLPENSTKLWYLPTDQIAGAAVSFEFGPIFTRGGKITKIDTWSLDAGTGLDDNFVIFTSEGEVAVYTGTDPASASTWSLQGVFYIGSPTGTGHTCKYGGDLLIINKDGISQMSKSLMSSRVSTWLQLTDKIQPRIAEDTTSYQGNSGWDLLLYPPMNMLLVNIPTGQNESYQYVMNTISGGWSRWTNIPAKCWIYTKDMLLFGANGYVGYMWSAQNDDGAEVVAEILPAYQSFGVQSRLKRWTMGRVLIGSDSDAVYGSRVEVDFNLNNKALTLPFNFQTSTAKYGTAVYGSSIYGGSIVIKSQWKNVTGVGYWGSLHMKISTKFADVRIYSYDLVMESGGNI